MSKRFIEETSSSFDEVIDLWNYFLEGNEAACPATAKDKILQNAEDYLLKGEKLFSLAKERFQKECTDISMSHIEEELYSVDFKDTKYVDSVVQTLQKFVRKVLQRAESEDNADLQGLLSLISPEYQAKIVFTSVNNEPNAVHYKQVAKGDQVLCLFLKDGNNPALCVYGLKNHTHSSAQVNRLYKSGDCIADIALVIAWLLIISIGSSALKTNLVEFPHYQMKDVFGLSGRKNLKDTSDTIEPIKHHFIKSCHRSDLDFSFWKPFFDHYNVDYEDVDEKSYSLRRAFVDRAGTEYASYDEVPFLFCRHTLKQFGVCFAKEILGVYGYLPLHLFLTPCDSCNNTINGYWPVPGMNDLADLVCAGFLEQYRLNHNKSVSLKNLRSLSSEYARSFMTKKNIPKATLDAMQKSHFNEYFGYVEYDEDVDLAKVKVIEEQFVAFKETYFPFIDATKNAIRFRRLGNHKASGLYYPNAACLCVDIHTPSSLIHEFGHLIDYCYGNLSTNSEFLSISKEYERHLEKAMRENESFKKTMNGKTKYNKDYYLIPTEIFARCFELYCKEVRGINNSLTPSAWGLAYPADKDFIEQIKDYFEAVFFTMTSSAEIVEELKVASI